MNPFGSKTELVEAIVFNSGVFPGKETIGNPEELGDQTEIARAYSLMTKKMVRLACFFLFVAIRSSSLSVGASSSNAATGGDDGLQVRRLLIQDIVLPC